ncbi:MAG: CDP-glucose 4,6-dehydratase [Candidatus Paracaedibacter sp.]
MSDILTQSFKGKSVFITGHTGFKGAWLAFWLTELGAKVTGYALPPEYQGSLFEKLNLSDRTNHIIGDIRDCDKLKKAILESKPEFVFHLAAQALVRRSYEDPLLTFSTNVMGSANLLESVRQCESVRSLVFITSDKCYWNKEWTWGYRENDELGGPDPYSASKASAEHVFKSYYLSYFKNRVHFGCGSTRAGNVIGGGDFSCDRIVPDIIRAINSGQPIILRNPGSTRPWQHVLDPLYGYMILALKLYQNPPFINGEAWNFGPSSHSIRTVLSLTQKLASLWEGAEIIVDSLKNSMHEANLLHLSIEKAQGILHWMPKYNFEQAVEKTGEWYQSIQQGKDAITVTIQQIKDFQTYNEKR